MFKYEQVYNQKLLNINNYCKYLKSCKRKNIDINKMNDLLLNRFKSRKIIKSKLYFPKKIYDYLEEEIKKDNYIIDEKRLIKILNEYRRINKVHYNYLDLYDLQQIVYLILITPISNMIDFETSNLIKYNSRKEKNIFNIVTSIDNLYLFNIENIINRVSDTDALLLSIKEFKDMDNISKNKYRKAIVENSLKENISEYQYTSKLISKCKKNNKLLGNYLLKKYNYKFISFLSILISIVISIIVFILMYFLFTTDLFLLILIFILNMRLVYLLINICLPKNFIPKYNKYDDNTMCIKYAVIDNETTLENEFKKIEEQYINCNNDNVYMTILADCTDSDHQIEPFDEEILEYGIKKTKELNDKYGYKKFSFVYRKRVVHDTLWHGFNRLNGAIENYIKLLLHYYSDLEEHTYFTGYTNLPSYIKYIMVIDSNTDIDNLRGIISHPYNNYDMVCEKGYCVYNTQYMRKNVIFSLEEYAKNLINKMPNNILFKDIFNCLVLHNSYLNEYNTESITKHNISMFLWKNKNIDKNKYILLIINYLINLIAVTLFIYGYINSNILIIIYLLFNNFISVPNKVVIKIITTIRYIFSKKYRDIVLEDNNYNYIVNIFISLILLILGYIFKVDLYIILLSLIIVNIRLVIDKIIRKFGVYDKF